MAQRIEDYALLGDMQTAALVGRDGSIDWLCLPRFDSPACFAALLGDEDNGHWRIAPAGAAQCTRRRYRDHSLVLETEWETPEGTVRVIDTMPPRGQAADVVRVVEGVSGTVRVEMSLVIRFDYGHLVPWVSRDGGQLRAVCGPDALWLRTPVPVEGKDLTTVASFDVSAGDRVPFVLTHQPSHLSAPDPVDAPAAVEQTEHFWRDWVAACDADTGEWDDVVKQSLVTLKALIYDPTGGLMAAATTSLPEAIGGPRNWDYRYCWLRDSTFTLSALLESGYVREAHAWREWLLRAIAGDPADLQIMYGLDGTRRLPETELPWLAGYEGSSPVRIGNAASEQLQLDVWGEVLDALHLSRLSGVGNSDRAWHVQRHLLDWLEGAWQRPDNGLWESRGPQRHHVYSKVMAWVGMDRAVQAVESRAVDGPVDRWRRTREAIRHDVLTKGFDAERNTFTQYYGSRGLDASLLLVGQVGFLPPHDPRVVGTIEAIDRTLTRDGLVRRYDPEGPDTDDGLPDGEGTFLACSFWMVDALCSIGQHDEARRRFERLVSLRNDVGLLSEEYDPVAGRQLGNTPQAYSHVGLVNSALNLRRGEASARTRPRRP